MMWRYLSQCGTLLILILISQGIAQDDGASSDILQEQHIDGSKTGNTPATNKATTNDYNPHPNTELNSAFIYSGLSLYNASARGDLVSVKKALASGTNPGWRNPNKDNSTSLHVAAQFNHPEIVKLLLDAGAEKDIQNDWGATPLFYASGEGSIDSATVLIARGASVDILSLYFGTALHFAAFSNQSDIVNLLLNAGAKKDMRDDEKSGLHRGATPLYYASRYGSIDIASQLIIHNASIDIPDRNGFTALHIAVKQNYPAIVRSLLDAGADTEVRDKDEDRTPLYYASRNPNTDAITLLIESGAVLDSHQRDETTTLQLAAWTNHAAVVSALLNAGANINNQDIYGRTPLYTASQTYLVNTVNLLLNANADVNVPSNNPQFEGTTALHISAYFDHLEVVRALVLNGADASKQEVSGLIPVERARLNGNHQVADFIISFAVQSTPATPYSGLYLYNASVRGNLTLVLETLAAGINPNWGNPYRNNSTPLHAAAQFNHPEVVNALLNAGAELNRQNDWGATPLFYASGKGSIDSATVLISRGASVDIPSFYFGTALHFAAFSNQSAIANLLLNAGADKDRQDDGELARHPGATPLYYAARYGSIDVTNLLISNNASVDIPASVNKGLTKRKGPPGWGHSKIYSTPLHAASAFNHPAIVSSLIDAGANIDWLDDMGRTPLYYAVRGWDLGSANILITRGANLDIPINEYTGSTVLHEASRSNKAALVSALLQAGADKDKQNDYGRTPLYDASRSGSIHVVKILIGANADVNTPSDDGTTALHIAARGGHLGVVRDLLRNGAEVRKVDNNGLTPLASAQQRERHQVAAYIKNFADTSIY